MRKKISYLITILPFIDVMVGLGMLAILRVVESQTKIITETLGLPSVTDSIIPVDFISIVVKVSSVGLIIISILKCIDSYTKNSKSL